MSEFYGRRFEILLNGDSFIVGGDGRQFKIVFNVLHDFGGFNSFCDIAIYNLSHDTASRAFIKGAEISLRAGYQDSVDTIFNGSIKNILRESAAPGIITRLICIAGTINPKSISQTIGVNGNLYTAIKAISSKLGYPLVIDKLDFSSTVFKKGKSLNGDPLKLLDGLAEDYSFNYVVENKRLVVVKSGKQRNTTPHVISQFTGMEGIPEITEIGVDVTIRLEPKIKIGGSILIESRFKTFNFSNIYFQDVKDSDGTGEYKILKVAHSGDSYGSEWSTKINGIRSTI